VAVTELLVRRGDIPRRLKGTVTWVDCLGRGDETDFVREVVGSTGVPNVEVRNHNLWDDDVEAAPLTDYPYLTYPFYARDRATVRAAKQAGATVMLSGVGSDQYLAGTDKFLADLVARGKLWQAAKLAVRWSIALRRSVWRYSWTRLVYPLLPFGVRRRRAVTRTHPYRWITPRFAGASAFVERMPSVQTLPGVAGNVWAGQVAQEVDLVSLAIDRGAFDEEFELRMPFLYRPLVEFALALPARARAIPYQTKLVLREAMYGILPESIRCRTGKGTIGARLRASLSVHRDRVNELCTNPILADLGCVEPKQLKRVVAHAQQGGGASILPLLDTLSLETWLRVRSGRWRTGTTPAAEPVRRS
jgi:asparagine synthetase B (glutamine-hydrolysing)